jgi:hypothetical protein
MAVLRTARGVSVDTSDVKQRLLSVGKQQVREYRVSKGLVRPANIMVGGTKIPGDLSLTIVGARGGGDCTLLFGLKKG